MAQPRPVYVPLPFKYGNWSFKIDSNYFDILDVFMVLEEKRV